MSLSYRVTLQVAEVVSADDKTVHQLDLQSILSEEEMRDLLRQSLIARGYEEEEEGKMVRREEYGEIMSADLDALEMTAGVDEAAGVRGKVGTWGDAWSRAGASRQAEANARDQANAMVGRGAKDAQRRVTQQLAEGEKERLEEMNETLQDVYAEALKRKAQKLGDVVDQHEGTNENGEYELVIKVEV